MVNEIRKLYLRELNKGFVSKFCEGSLVRQETPEGGQRTDRPKRWEYNNKYEDNCPNTLIDKIIMLHFKKLNK